MTSQSLVFPNDRTPLDLLLFLAFKREVPGLVDLVLAANPGLAALGPFPPRGTSVLVPSPPPASSLNSTPLVTLYS